MGIEYDQDLLDEQAGHIQVLEAENERLRAALKECAAEWKSGPGSVYECFNQARYEFLRRMEVARAALNHEQKADRTRSR